MKAIRVEFLRTKVARRLFGLFITLAVVPVTVLAVASTVALLSQLRAQALDTMAEQNAIAEQMIIDRLQRSQQDLLNVRRLRNANIRPDGLPPGIEGVAVVTAGGVQEESGRTLSPPALDAAQQESLRSGRTVLIADASPSGGRVLMGVPADSTDPARGVLWGALTVDSLLGSAIVAVDGYNTANFCILDSESRPFVCTSPSASELPAMVPPHGDSLRLHTDDIELDFGGDRYLGAYREVFLSTVFSADPWAVAISESTASIYATLNTFRLNYPIGIFIGLMSAVFATVVIVRRMMDPLEQLTDGTRRISRRDHAARVRVESNNEFGELATSFNEMASRIGRQFDQLEAGREIDQAALHTPDHAEAVAAILKGVGQVLSCSHRSVVVLEPGGQDTPQLYWSEGGPAAPMQSSTLVERVPLWPASADAHLLVQEWEGLTERSRSEGQVSGRLQTAGVDIPERLQAAGVDVPERFQAAGFDRESLPLLVLPLMVHGETIGEVAAGGDARRVFTDEDVDRARQLVDQAAVALNDVRLRRELAEISWEALRALANGIDAKSKWTSGHSQRVTEMAVLLGQQLDLSEKDLEVLRRGSLLHDIGKIGIPATILDLPHGLSPEQRAVMKSHTTIGARILAPVRAFQPMIPIVLHHHEHWDGGGYPEGLAGEAIPELARVVSVADVFDAMVSARPYRDAMGPEEVQDIIVSDSGTQFEPRVVEALQRLMERGFTPSEGQEVSLIDV